jgi:DNA-binding NtrC family response regulator
VGPCALREASGGRESGDARSVVDLESQEIQAGYAAREQRRGPRYFHLLWEEDLDDLAPALRAVRDRRAEVVSSWYALYTLHFSDFRALSEAEFRRIFEPALLRHKNHLLAKDMDSYTRDMMAFGRRLAERRVPLQEIITSLHLFEESAQSVFPPDLRPEVRIKFDRLSHIRIILLVDAYSREHASWDSTRIAALESEAQQMSARDRAYFHGLVGKSQAMHTLYELIESAGQTRGTVLIVGETGTGKELTARAIHECGGEATRPFVALNCAALPKDLIESELFGYKRGAFSGANSEFLGLFRAAEGGTLFLDEITEMGADTQAKLLRTLQEHMVRPVGSTREVPVSARILASTNRDPLLAVKSGRLREDLYYRLQASVIRVPPLRERLEDVRLLAEYFVERFNQQRVRPTPVVGIDREAIAKLAAHWWPGNVRELSNAIESASTFGRSATIELSDLPSSLVNRRPSISPAVRPHVPSIAEVECDLIRRALEMTNGNLSETARILKISRKRVYAKIAMYNLK